jgi:SAM-dependent methyltransferase
LKAIDQRDYQLAHYDRHYPRHAAAVRQQLAHPLFRSWNDRIARRVLDLAPPVEGRPLRVYEVACGEGLLASALHRVATERGMELDYTGSDLSAGGLEVAQAVVPGATLLVGDATEVTAGLPAGGFDVVVAKNLMHHIDDPAPFLRASARAVESRAEPPGRVVIVEARLANLPFFLSTFLFAYRRERLFFRGRRRNLAEPVDHAGLTVVHADLFSWLPYELFLAIRVDWFRRLLSTDDRRTLARISALDDWLTRVMPWGSCYDVWALSAAADRSNST